MKKRFLAAGLMALLILGVIVAVNAVEGRVGFLHGFGMKGWGMDKVSAIEDLDLPEDATPQEIKEALWQKRLSDLGLTEDSTIGELRKAVEARMQERRQEMLGKLGLDDDATPQEIRDAMKQYPPENQDDCPRMMKGAFGRGRLHITTTTAE